jgi:hypothetical protein
VGQGFLQRRAVVELDDTGCALRLHRRADVAGTGDDPTFAQDGERLVHSTVVAPVEDQDTGATGDLPRYPDREPVGIGSAQGHLPQGQAESFGQGLADRRGVGRGHHGGDGAG